MMVPWADVDAENLIHGLHGLHGLKVDQSDQDDGLQMLPPQR